jgi:hypothetical protein
VEDRFGTSLAAGDANDDGKADIAVGAYWEDVGGNVNQGRAYVFSGADGSLLHTLDMPIPQAQEDAEFGYSLAVGEVNGDGRGEIAIGAAGETLGGIEQAGRAYVYGFPATPSGSHRRSHTPTPSPTPVATSTPVPSATPVPPPLATPTPIGIGAVGPSVVAPSTGSGGGSSTPGGGSGWLFGAYAALGGMVVVIAVGGWYVRRRRLR